MPSITVVTANATQDALTDADYAEIYAELRDGISLAKFCTLPGVESSFSPATWNKWELGRLPLSRTMRNELRRGVGMDALPLTIAECVAAVDQDAEVVQIGDAPANRVILTGLVGRLSLSLNGSVTLADASAQETPITSVISTQGARRDKRHRLTVTSENYEWLQGAGVTVNEAIERLRQTS